MNGSWTRDPNLSPSICELLALSASSLEINKLICVWLSNSQMGKRKEVLYAISIPVSVGLRMEK